MALVYQCSSFHYDNSLLVCDSAAWVDVSDVTQTYLSVTDPAFLQLLESTLPFFALAFVFNFLFKFIMNR